MVSLSEGAVIPSSCAARVKLRAHQIHGERGFLLLRGAREAAGLRNPQECQNAVELVLAHCEAIPNDLVEL